MLVTKTNKALLNFHKVTEHAEPYIYMIVKEIDQSKDS